MGREQSIDITEKRQAATLKSIPNIPTRKWWSCDGDTFFKADRMVHQIASIREESILKKMQIIYLHLSLIGFLMLESRSMTQISRSEA